MGREHESGATVTRPGALGGDSPRTPGFTAEASVYRSRGDYQAIRGGRPPGSRARRERRHLTGYDPRWPVLFEEERRRMRAVLGNRVRGIEHVGSSAVPGLAGRSEIDVLVGVKSGDDLAECARLLTGLGYKTVDRSESPSEPWYLMTRKGSVPFELLVVGHDSPLWQRHLSLRQLLRNNPKRAASYVRLKSEWAARYGTDTENYKEAKRRFWSSVG